MLKDHISGAVDLMSAAKQDAGKQLAKASKAWSGEHEAEVRSYGEIHHHILAMADALSDGIAAQFPQKFR